MDMQSTGQKEQNLKFVLSPNRKISDIPSETPEGLPSLLRSVSLLNIELMPLPSLPECGSVPQGNMV